MSIFITFFIDDLRLAGMKIQYSYYSRESHCVEYRPKSRKVKGFFKMTNDYTYSNYVECFERLEEMIVSEHDLYTYWDRYCQYCELKGIEAIDDLFEAIWKLRFSESANIVKKSIIVNEENASLINCYE